MKIQNIFFLLLCFGMKTLAANNLINHHCPAGFEVEHNLSCNLPAPDNIFVVSVSPDSVTVGWSQVSGATQYRLSVHNAANGNLLGLPVMVSATQISAKLSLAGHTGSAFVKIHSVCPSGEWDESLFNVTPDFGIPIIELVASGFTVPESFGSQEVGFNYSNGVDVNWTGAMEYFQVEYNFMERIWQRDFALYVDQTSHKVRIQIGGTSGATHKQAEMEANVNQYIVFQERLDLSNNVIGIYVRFRSNLNQPYSEAQIIAEFTLEKITANGNGVLYKRAPYHDPGCTIYKYLFGSTLSSPGNNRTEIDAELADDRSTSSSPLPLSANPNPFRDAITVQLPQSTSENARMLYLYDLLGTRRLSYQVPGNQTESNLNTSLLTPGVYFLRIETDGKMETLKLLKTQ